MPRKGTEMELSAETLAQRVGLALREIHPTNTTKLVMTDFNAKFDTARAWVEGRRAPQAHRLLEMGRKYGPRFMARLDEEALWSQRIRVAEARLEALRARRDALDAEVAALEAEMEGRE